MRNRIWSYGLSRVSLLNRVELEFDWLYKGALSPALERVAELFFCTPSFLVLRLSEPVFCTKLLKLLVDSNLKALCSDLEIIHVSIGRGGIDEIFTMVRSTVNIL